jgi:hypothetical protein
MTHIAMKSSHLYLYLALACFAAILAIFVVDGYMGVYDKLVLTVQEREQVVEPDQWQQRWVKESGFSSGARWGEAISFKYQIQNRTFSAYSAAVEATIWKGGEKISQLLKENVVIPPFDEATLNWAVLAKDFREAGLKAGEYGEYTVRVTFGDVERKIILSYYPEIPGYPEKGPIPAIPVPAPTR